MTPKRLLDVFHSVLFLKIDNSIVLALVRIVKETENAPISIEESPFFLFSIVQIEFEGINFYHFY